jgi:hypothetical protein
MDRTAGSEIVPRELHRQYPTLAADFDVLEQELVPRFAQLDAEAMRAQRQFRRERMALIVGGTVASILGAVQTALGTATWPGIAEAIISAFLAAITLYLRQLKSQDRYCTNRLKAETLRGEYFMFLGRLDPYGDEATRVRRLRLKVASVVAGEEPA